MIRLFGKRMSSQKGFTLIELMLVVAIIGILATIAIPLWADVQVRARIAKARADLRGMASAVSLFQAHMGTLPAALSDLSVEQTNPQGQKAGPFMDNIPAPPFGWSNYATGATFDAAIGTFKLTTNGDSTTVTVP